MSAAPAAKRRPRAGPPLGPVIGVAIGLFIASLVVPAMISGGTAYPSPMGADTAVARYAAEHPGALAAGALLQFAASVPLVVFGASATAQLWRIGVRAAGPLIATVGAVLASGAMALSALLQWTLSQAAPDAPLTLLVAIRDLAFVVGGPWHTVGLGLLVAGIAVPALFYRLLPRWLTRAGILIAVVCELTTLALILPAAAYAIPLGRFPALLWLLTAGVLLPATRNRSGPR